MFQKIQHIGYLTSDLEAAVVWFQQSFGAVNAGGGPMAESYAVPSGGRNAFVNFGQVQVELIEPGDAADMSGDAHTMDHVGYAVGDIPSCMGGCQARGLKFVADAPITNSVGQQVLYFDTETTNGSRMHLTRLPD